MKKRSIALLLVILTLVSLSFAGCAKKEEKQVEAVFTSEDGKYEFHGTAKGLAWITETGKTEKLVEGSIKVREENSAITVTIDGDIMSMVETPTQVSFTHPVNGSDVTFVLHRGKLMEALNCKGVVLNTAAGSQGFAVGLLFWNDGTVQTMVMKIQSTHNYSYSAAEGLKIETTAEQLEQYGNLWLESYDAAEGTYVVGYDLTVPMPPMLPNPGTFTVTAEQLKDAFGE